MSVTKLTANKLDKHCTELGTPVCASTPTISNIQSSRNPKRPLPTSPTNVKMADIAGSCVDDDQTHSNAEDFDMCKLWDMLVSIKADTAATNNKLDCLDNRVLVLEDQHDHTGTEIAKMKESMAEIIESNRTLVGRLLRAEIQIDRQKTEITDMRMRMMRDNIIIRTKGNDYKANRDEDTASVFRNFVTREMRVADADKIHISRAHRMGQPSGDNNKLIIAKVPSDQDHKRIFANARSLQKTNFSISRQFPRETEERRQFSWPAFKSARAAKTPARYDGARLVINNEPVTKYEPAYLPAFSSSIQGNSHAMNWGISDPLVENGHTFKAWATHVKDLQGVREAYDKLLQHDEAAGANYVSYGFRYNANESPMENFVSDEDNGAGLHIIKTLRSKQANNVVVFVAHMIPDTHVNITMKLKMNSISQVVAGSLMSLDIEPVDMDVNFTDTI